ncbi:PREDICTED: multiple epidermal growth factor-like domains protein 6 [Capra hircus]|uniref:multiple epidermal growth factor-like domains protein 6 n=1 Tax=Capra hircus TaxID=9925 RepID=UPI000847AD3E|nr:PREDICTED: multiple epidermal growth factor-like domains protein 6 [Capra hircus]
MEAVPVPLDGQEIIVKKNVFLVILLQAAILIARVRTMEFAVGFLEECEYLPGYYGRDCEHACLPGFYGLNCVHICDCKNEANCDAASGQCICPAGFHGNQCEKECSAGMFGDNCHQLCDCERDPATQ